MRGLFLGREIMGVVHGSVAQPAAAQAVELGEWVKKDGQAISALCDALDESMLDLVSGCITSKEIWDKLKVVHDQRANHNMHDLQVKFHRCQFESSDTVASFMSKVRVLKSQLHRLGDTGVGESNVIANVLGNLPDSYGQFHSAWDNTSSADRTLTNLLICLVREELRLKEAAAREHQTSHAPAYVAMKAKSPSQKPKAKPEIPHMSENRCS